MIVLFFFPITCESLFAVIAIVSLSSKYAPKLLFQIRHIDFTDQTINTQRNLDLQRDVQSLQERLDENKKSYEELSGINTQYKEDLNMIQEQKAARDKRIEELTNEIQRYKTQGEEQQQQI